MSKTAELSDWLDGVPGTCDSAVAIIMHPFYDTQCTPTYLPALEQLLPKVQVPTIIIEDEDPVRAQQRLEAMGLRAPHYTLQSRRADSALQDLEWHDLAMMLRARGYRRAMLLGGYLNQHPRSGCLIGAQEELSRAGIQAPIREDVTYGIDSQTQPND